MRTQSGLIEGIRPANRTLRERNSAIIGKVVKIFPEHQAAHIMTQWGGMLRYVTIINGGSAGTRQGARTLPAVINKDPFRDREGVSWIDEYSKRELRDTMAIVVFIDGTLYKPVCWILPPNFAQNTFWETNLDVDRHGADVYETTYAMDNPDDETLRGMLQHYTGDNEDEGTEDAPSPWVYPRMANWERVYPDRRRLTGPDPLQEHPPRFEPGNDGFLPLGLETYEAVGYGFDETKFKEQPPPNGRGQYRGKDFQETPFSAKPLPYPNDMFGVNRRPLGYAEKGIHNFDADSQSWRRHRENKARFARGLRQNQRWGTFTELSRSGDVWVVAEGLNKNVHPEVDIDAGDPDAVVAKMAKEPNWGSIHQYSRIEERHLTKGGWFHFRKRWQWGGRLEDWNTVVSEGKENDLVDIRRWGLARFRSQRTFQALSRLETEFGAREVVRILAGKASDHPDENPGGGWSRDDLHYGADGERYRDRTSWRNSDSKELANIIVRSVREKLKSAFGNDDAKRGESEGGEIHIETMPEEKDHALIELQSIAPRNDGKITGLAQAGTAKGNEGEGNDALVAWFSRSWKNDATIELWANAGRGDNEGKRATLFGHASTRESDALVRLLARTGDVENSEGGVAQDANNATVDVEADAAKDNALIDLYAHTEKGSTATLTGRTKAHQGPSLISLSATVEVDGSATLQGEAQLDQGDANVAWTAKSEKGAAQLTETATTEEGPAGHAIAVSAQDGPVTGTETYQTQDGPSSYVRTLTTQAGQVSLTELASTEAGDATWSVTAQAQSGEATGTLTVQADGAATLLLQALSPAALLHLLSGHDLTIETENLLTIKAKQVQWTVTESVDFAVPTLTKNGVALELVSDAG